jgi:NFU1 iron-sulfur cluster scaffold homolog, mitochondrial
MGYRIIEFQTTPNPNALKCILSPAMPATMRSFRSSDEARASGDRLAQSLFEVPGVSGLLFAGQWVTINKLPGTDWASIRHAVGLVLESSEPSGD